MPCASIVLSFGFGLPTHDKPVIFRPFGRVSIGVSPLLEHIVVLELPLNLTQEAFGNGPGMAEYPNRHLGIPQNVLDGQRKGDDGRLVMFTGPQV